MVNNTIYYIDQSIKNEFANRALKPEEELFFNDLAAAYQRGDCYLCGDLGSLEFLYQKLPGVSQKIYRIIKSHHLENGAAMNSVHCVFVLTYQEVPSLTSLPEILQNKNKCCFICIPEAIAENWRLSTKCCFLSENLDDINFYLFIARYYCHKMHIPHQRIGFHTENGGGNTTCDVFKKCVSQDKNLVLCISDSDKKYGKTRDYPAEPAIGDTLKRIQAKAKEIDALAEHLPYHLFPLHVHEVENLIPFQLLQSLSQKSLPDILPKLGYVLQLQSIKNGEPLLYYDYKKGFPYIKSAPQRAYWQEILMELGGELSSMPPQEKQEEGTYCPDALFFPPLHRNLLAHTLNIITSEADSLLKSLHIDDYLKNIWDDIGLQLLTWGYVNEPIRA